jgi:hypothetical protein
MAAEIDGQLNAREREILTRAILEANPRPQIVLEVGTWLGGGSTVHFLRALEKNGAGHLFGIECDRTIYKQMIDNIRAWAPEAAHRFTPLFGFSQQVIPKWIAEQKPGFQVDVAFLDGGNHPFEQIEEFWLIDAHMPVGSKLLSHDAKLRKGKWLVPYVSLLDNWRSELHDVSNEGLFVASKIAPQPSPESLRAAKARLRRLKLAPAEIAGRLAGPKLRKFAARILPQKLVRRLAEGQPG